MIMFPNLFAEKKQLVYEGSVVFADCKISLKDDEDPKLIIESILPADEFEKLLCLWIRFPSYNEKSLKECMDILSSVNGDMKAVLYFEDTKKRLSPKQLSGVSVNIDLINRLKRTYGDNNIKIT